MNINDLNGDDLFAYLRVNKENLIQAKKGSLKLCDSVVSTVVVTPRESKEHTSSTKAESNSEEEPSSPDTLKVTIVANTANIVDSHMDMLTDDAYTESIKARGSTIPHILDHNQSAVGHIGDVTKVYTKSIDLKTLGLASEGTTTALLMDSTVRKDYNEQAFKFYAAGKINQHSIGLTYGEIHMAINSKHEEDKVEKAVWDEFYPKVINKDVVDKRGYFWVVPKVDVRENSAVLFGSNPLTPTLSISKEEISSLHSKDSPLGNIPSNTNQPIGNTTMTLEEAQGKIISLTNELASVKAEAATAALKATADERQRTMSILKAQETFGKDAKLQKAALSFIEKGTAYETVVASLEVIKEALQAENPVDTTNSEAASLNKSDLGGKDDFHSVLGKAIEKMATNSTEAFRGRY
jgi:hypothetical protein